MRILAGTLCLGLAATVLPAVEPVVDDLRLVVEARPTAYRFTWDAPAGSRSGDDRLDQAWSAGLGWRWARPRPGRPAALLFGIEAVGQYDAMTDATRLGQALRGEAGLAYGLHNRLLLTCAPVAGIGRGTWRVRGGAGPDADLAGTQVEAGLRAGLRWSLDARWSLSAEGAWWWSRERSEGGGSRLAIERSGPAALIALAWTLDPATRRME